MIKKSIAIFLTFTFLSTQLAYPLPQNPNVVEGKAGIDIQDNIMTVTADDKTIIDFDSFDISPSEQLIINLPNASSEILNRVIPGGPSSLIAGSLTCNGLVIIINTAGIFVAPTANIDVGSIILSTRDIANNNFLNGEYLFEKITREQLDTILKNAGTINVREGGFGVLIAGAIENEGTVVAPIGKIALASGDAVKLDIGGDGLVSVIIDEKVASKIYDHEGNAITEQIKNTGNLEAEGGVVILDAESITDIFTKAINLDGFVRANKIEERDGLIKVVADGDVDIKANLEATKIEIGDETRPIEGEVIIESESINAEESIINAEKVEFVGTEPVHLYGDMTIYNFESTQPNKEIYFEHDKTYTLLGDWKLQGAYGEHIKLLSDEKGKQWFVNPQAERDISYTWVEDSYNINPLEIIMLESTNRGNSFNWDPDGRWTGLKNELWSEAENWSGLGGATPGEGDNVIFDNTDKNSAIDTRWRPKAINNFTIGTNYTGTITQNKSKFTINGDFSQAGGTYDVNDNRIYIDGNTQISGGTYNTGTDRNTFGDGFEDRVMITGGTINIESDNPRSDIKKKALLWFTFGGTIVYKAENPVDTEMLKLPYYNLVIDSEGSNYAAYGNVKVENDFTLKNGTLDAADNELTIKGDTEILGGRLKTGTNTVTFGRNSRNRVTISDGVLEIESDDPQRDIIKNAGTWNNLGGTIIYNAENPIDAYILSSLGQYHNLVIDSEGSTYKLDESIDVSNDFTLRNGTFDANDNRLIIRGNTEIVDGTFKTGTDTITFGGDRVTMRAGVLEIESANIGNSAGEWNNLGGTIIYKSQNPVNAYLISGISSYNNLEIDSENSTYKLSQDIDVNGDMEIKNGTLDVSQNNYGITLAGNWSNEGRFIAREGRVTFDKDSGTQSLDSGGIGEGYSFNNLTHSGNGTLKIVENDLDINGDFVNSAGEFDADGHDMYVGGNWVNQANFESGSNTVTFDGGGTQILDSGEGHSFNNIIYSGSGMLQLVNHGLDVDDTLVILEGRTFDLNGNDLNHGNKFEVQNGSTLRLHGDENLTTPTLGKDTTIQYNGSAGPYTLKDWQYENLGLSSNSNATYNLPSDLIVKSDLSIDEGATLDVTTKNYNINFGGDWNNRGNFVAQGGTVTLNGDNQKLSGSTEFYNLEKVTKLPDTLTFESGSQQTILNMLTLGGAPGKLLKLRSDSPGAQWKIDTRGISNIKFVDVQDSYNMSGEYLEPLHSIDSGNNTFWFKPYVPPLRGGASTIGLQTIESPTRDRLKNYFEYIRSWIGKVVEILRAEKFVNTDIYEFREEAKKEIMVQPEPKEEPSKEPSIKEKLYELKDKLKIKLREPTIPVPAPLPLLITGKSLEADEDAAKKEGSLVSKQ